MTAPQDEQNFARRMAEIRTKLDMSQSELARRMVENGFENYSQMTVSRTEKGDRPIRLGEARVLAKILESSVEEMARGTEEEVAISAAGVIAEGLGAAMLATVHALGDYLEALEHALDVRSRLTSYESSDAREAFENLDAYMFPTKIVADWAAETVTDVLRDVPEVIAWSDLDRMAELEGGAPPKAGYFKSGSDSGVDQEAP